MNKKIGKGSTTKLMGYVCSFKWEDTGISENIFFENKHGFCEMYIKK